MDLLIVRHGRPERSLDTADPPLSETGREQAKALAQRLAPEPIDNIISSTMTRAAQTAAPLAEVKGLELVQRDDLREAHEHSGRYVPAEEMSMDDDFMKAMAEDPMTIFEHGYDHFRDGVVGAFEDIIASHRGKTVAVVCHGMVMGSYLQHLWQLEGPFVSQFDYTGIMRIAAASNGLRTVKSVNETGHVFSTLSGWGSEAKKP